MTLREPGPSDPAPMSRKDHSPMTRRAVLLLAWTFCALVPATLEADDSPVSPPLFSAEKTAIARAFAPLFIFHPDEQYFPVSSAFPMTLEDDVDAEMMASSGAREQLGSPEERAERYVALPHQKRVSLAAVGYRVFTRFRHGETEVVVEYWCHYVYNAFTIRGTWLPYRISGNHPQDLERLFLVLSPVPDGPSPTGEPDEAWARRAFRIQRIVANAHDGSVPANEYEVKDGRDLETPVNILVERGSHAMAPDINHDGRFTPEVDSTRTRKLLWGIRDGGSTWGWFRSGQMDARDTDRSVRLCARLSTGEPASGNCSAYRLYQIEDIQRWFDTLDLSEKDRREVIGSTSLFTRTFSNVRVEELMVPHDQPDGRVPDRMLRRRPPSGQGIVAGFASLNNAPGFAVGPRLFRDVTSRRWPDVIAEGVALFPRGQNPVAKASVFGSYTIDAMTNVLIGADWISRAHPSADVVTGIEFHIGMIVVRPSWRLREGVFDSMVVAVF
jgi:hypothetical protein